MKTHTTYFKNQIKKLGRELDSIITYEQNNETIELGNEQLNSIESHYEGAILKSVMKQLDIDSNVEIPEGTILNYQFGVKVRNQNVQDYRDNYDYINFGNYVVYKVEKQEDTNSYKIICYDKMLYSMVDYVDLELIYPITIRNYINAICQHLGLTFKNANSTFANYDKEISKELFLSSDGISLEYTFRDVLDQLAGATASTICINENDDELEIRYVNDTEDTINEEYLKNLNVNFGEKYGPVNSIVLSRSAESDNVYLQDEESVEENGLCELKIIDNQIMNFNDRSDYLEDILEQLDGLEYYINDYSSTGVCYYNLCDKYNVQIGDNTYSCIMFNDEVNITSGLEENVNTKRPNESETDYKKADKTDQKINKTYIIVDKQQGQIESVVENVGILQTSTSQNADNINRLTSMVNSQGENIEALGTRITQTADSINASVSAIQGEIDEGVGLVRTTSVTIDDSGLNVSTDTSKISTTMTNNSFQIKDKSDKTLAFFGYDEAEGISKAEMDNLTVTNYFVAGAHRIEKMEVSGEERTGHFYIGG